VAGSCEHGNEHLGSIKEGNFLTSCVIISFSRGTLHHKVNYLDGYFSTNIRICES
jgi:hypothetical protein